MAPRKKSAPKAAEGNEDRGELTKVAVIEDRTIINGHVLQAGTVVGLYPDEIEAHRNGGVPLDDVADDDEREVFDVQTPFEATEEAEAKDE